MAPLIVLLVVTAIARGVGALGADYVDTWPEAAAVGLAAMFVLTGASHFVPGRREGLVAIVPPAFPAPGAIVSATGALELLGALGLLAPPELGPWRMLAAWCLAALMVAMFPANVYASRERRSETAPTTPLLPRTLIQVVYIAAAVFVAVNS